MAVLDVTQEQILRFHGRAHVDEIMHLCSESEKRGRAAEAVANSKARRGSGLWRAGIVPIDGDTAVMPASREAILRAAGAACFAVDEVRRVTFYLNAYMCVGMVFGSI